MLASQACIPREVSGHMVNYTGAYHLMRLGGGLRGKKGVVAKTATVGMACGSPQDSLLSIEVQASKKLSVR